MGPLKLFLGPFLHNHFRPITLDPTDRYLNSVGTLLPCSEDKDDRLSSPFLPRPSSPLGLITVYLSRSFALFLTRSYGGLIYRVGIYGGELRNEGERLTCAPLDIQNIFS